MKVTAAMIMGLLRKQGGKCALTGTDLTPENCSLDHALPVARGGTHDESNLQLVTKAINQAKGQMTNEEFVSMCSCVTAVIERRLKSLSQNGI